MAFKKTKQEALDLLQEKEKRLAELTEESAYAVQMVQNTIDNLQAVNSDIQTTMDCLKVGIEAAGLQGTYSEETIAIVRYCKSPQNVVTQGL